MSGICDDVIDNIILPMLAHTEHAEKMNKTFELINRLELKTDSYTPVNLLIDKYGYKDQTYICGIKRFRNVELGDKKFCHKKKADARRKGYIPSGYNHSCSNGVHWDHKRIEYDCSEHRGSRHCYGEVDHGWYSSSNPFWDTTPP